MCAVALSGCEEGDGYLDVGYSQIYIPQATITGLNNHYPVPAGGNELTARNWVLSSDGKTFDVLLGVMRSGSISEASGFSVDVVVSQSETNEVLASGEIGNAVALPSNLYEMPAKVTVPAGVNGVSFSLSLDLTKLLDGTYNGQKLVLTVSIANPTGYVLSETNTSVVVIVDVDAVRGIVESE
jgi:hypothetical protein